MMRVILKESVCEFDLSTIDIRVMMRDMGGAYISKAKIRHKVLQPEDYSYVPFKNCFIKPDYFIGTNEKLYLEKASDLIHFKDPTYVDFKEVNVSGHRSEGLSVLLITWYLGSDRCNWAYKRIDAHRLPAIILNDVLFT